MRAAVLCVGTELTTGDVGDEHGAWLARELTELGFEVGEITIVGDGLVAVSAALARLGAAYDRVVCTGGLGPTTDDITAAGAAAALGIGLRRDAESVERIRARLAARGLPLTESNAKQADLPIGARAVPNDCGTAPGFVLRVGRADAWFLPGVPQEMRAMFAAQVAPALRGTSRGARKVLRVRTFGLAESLIGERLAGIEAAYGVELGYRAEAPEVEVKVQACRASASQAEAAARAAADAIVERLGRDVVYAEGDLALPGVVGAQLVARGLQLAVAESCTGGLVGELLTELPGASRYFVGGAIVYANSTKEALLGVPAALLARHGAVSAEVATAMAEGALRACAADLALAITGVAGPDGGTAAKPVGLVELAVVGGGRTSNRREVFGGPRGRVRRLAAWTGLHLVLRHLHDRGTSP